MHCRSIGSWLTKQKNRCVDGTELNKSLFEFCEQTRSVFWRLFMFNPRQRCHNNKSRVFFREVKVSITTVSGVKFIATAKGWPSTRHGVANSELCAFPKRWKPINIKCSLFFHCFLIKYVSNQGRVCESLSVFGENDFLMKNVKFW